MLYINDEPVEATHFAYDGCHKVYLIFNADDLVLATECGYQDRDIYPVSRLPEVWKQTCMLRFISDIALSRQYVEQCSEYETVEYKEENE